MKWSDLQKLNPFHSDGRVKTSFDQKCAEASLWDGEEMKTPTRETLDAVSKVDRRTGLPKGA